MIIFAFCKSYKSTLKLEISSLKSKSALKLGNVNICSGMLAMREYSPMEMLAWPWPLWSTDLIHYYCGSKLPRNPTNAPFQVLLHAPYI